MKYKVFSGFVRLSPEAFTFNGIQVGEPNYKIVMIENIGNRPLKISEIQARFNIDTAYELDYLTLESISTETENLEFFVGIDAISGNDFPSLLLLEPQEVLALRLKFTSTGEDLEGEVLLKTNG